MAPSLCKLLSLNRLDTYLVLATKINNPMATFLSLESNNMNTDQTSPWSNLIWVHEYLQKTCLIEKVGKEEKLLIAHLYFVYYVQQERHQLV